MCNRTFYYYTYVAVLCNLLRSGIPVVIMGETGCGKTRLIRYMCDLARQGKDKNNMVTLKVSICT